MAPGGKFQRLEKQLRKSSNVWPRPPKRLRTDTTRDARGMRVFATAGGHEYSGVDGEARFMTIGLPGGPGRPIALDAPEIAGGHCATVTEV